MKNNMLVLVLVPFFVNPIFSMEKSGEQLVKFDAFANQIENESERKLYLQVVDYLPKGKQLKEFNALSHCITQRWGKQDSSRKDEVSLKEAISVYDKAIDIFQELGYPLPEAIFKYKNLSPDQLYKIKTEDGYEILAEKKRLDEKSDYFKKAVNNENSILLPEIYPGKIVANFLMGDKLLSPDMYSTNDFQCFIPGLYLSKDLGLSELHKILKRDLLAMVRTGNYLLPLENAQDIFNFIYDEGAYTFLSSEEAIYAQPSYCDQYLLTFDPKKYKVKNGLLVKKQSEQNVELVSQDEFMKMTADMIVSRLGDTSKLALEMGAPEQIIPVANAFEIAESLVKSYEETNQKLSMPKKFGPIIDLAQLKRNEEKA